MRGSLLILIALAAPAHADPACVDVDKYDAAVAAATKANDARYQAALAKKKLSPVTLPAASWPAANPPKQDVVEPRTTVKGHRASFLLVGESTCEPDLDFVQDGTKIFRVGRKLTAGTVKKLGAVCGCGPNRRIIGNCGGGAVRPMMQWGYELPAGTTYAGQAVVEYTSDRVEGTFTKGNCPPPP